MPNLPPAGIAVLEQAHTLLVNRSRGNIFGCGRVGRFSSFWVEETKEESQAQRQGLTLRGAYSWYRELWLKWHWLQWQSPTVTVFWYQKDLLILKTVRYCDNRLQWHFIWAKTMDKNHISKYGTHGFPAWSESLPMRAATAEMMDGPPSHRARRLLLRDVRDTSGVTQWYFRNFIDITGIAWIHMFDR